MPFYRSAGHVPPKLGAPKRYLSKHGQLLEHAPYCERDLRLPSDPVVVEAGETEGAALTRARFVELLADAAALPPRDEPVPSAVEAHLLRRTGPDAASSGRSCAAPGVGTSCRRQALPRGLRVTWTWRSSL